METLVIFGGKTGCMQSEGVKKGEMLYIVL